MLRCVGNLSGPPETWSRRACGYTYNSDGEQLSATQGSTTTASATWNGAASLTGYSDSAADMTSASYNGDGLRQVSSSTPAGGSAVSQGYVWNVEGSLPQVLMDGTNAYIYASGVAPAEQVNLATGAVTYLVTDSLGSVRGTVSGSGSLTGTTNYDAWGNPETAGGLAASTPFGYAGGYTDADGLVYLLARYYSPATWQFISVDPLVEQTSQPYAYAGGNPVSATDPTGRSIERDGWYFAVGLSPAQQRAILSGSVAVAGGVVAWLCAWLGPFSVLCDIADSGLVQYLGSLVSDLYHPTKTLWLAFQVLTKRVWFVTIPYGLRYIGHAYENTPMALP